MSKHTPGPWSVSELDAKDEPSEYYIFIEPGVAVIERKVDGSNQCDMPDARLIAAAPELLAALQRILESDPCRCLDGDKVGDCDFCQGRIAFAKATGEQS